MRTRQNRQGDKTDGGDFQKLQNNTQDINPQDSSDGWELASQPGENKSRASQSRPGAAGEDASIFKNTLRCKDFQQRRGNLQNAVIAGRTASFSQTLRK
jgi:hypothetical protein